MCSDAKQQECSSPIVGVGEAVDTLTEGAAQVLRRMIEAGELGEPMPPERQLAPLLGVSRITVRRALADLEEQEVIRRERGRGTYAVGGPSMTDVEALAVERKSVVVVLVQQDGERFNPQLTPWTWRICRLLEPLLAERGQVMRFVNDEAFLAAAARGLFDKQSIAGVVVPTHRWTDEQYEAAGRFAWPWVGLGRTSLTWFWNILDPDWCGALCEAIDDLAPSPTSRVLIPVDPQPIEIDQQLWLQAAMQRLSVHGVTQDRITVRADGPFETHGYLATRGYLREFGRPSLVLGSFDLTVAGAYRALQAHDEQGLAGIGFLGAADLEIGRYLQPRLSTLGIDYDRVARTLIEMLDGQKQSGQSVGLHHVPACYIRRESSGVGRDA